MPPRHHLTLLAVAALAFAACSDDAALTSSQIDLATLASPGPHGVAEIEVRLVDTSRPTAANGSFPGAPERTLPTRVIYPIGAKDDGPPLEVDAPFPILGWAHGYTSANFESRVVGRHLASHGYVVVAPTFPLSNGGAPGEPTIADMPHQPGDLDFAMRQVESGAAGAEIAALVDPTRRGVAGLSLGGATVLIAAHHPRWHIEDIQAAVALAPASCFFGPDLYDRALPTVIVTGTADMLVRLNGGPRQAFEYAPPPTSLVTLEGGNHVGFIGVELPGTANADESVGCPAIGTGGSRAAAGFEKLAALLVEGAGPGAVDRSTCTMGVCEEVLQQTMSAERQLEITRAVALAHFDAVLRGNRAAARWLERELAGEANDLTVATRR